MTCGVAARPPWVIQSHEEQHGAVCDWVPWKANHPPKATRRTPIAAGDRNPRRDRAVRPAP